MNTTYLIASIEGGGTPGLLCLAAKYGIGVMGGGGQCGIECHDWVSIFEFKNRYYWHRLTTYWHSSNHLCQSRYFVLCIYTSLLQNNRTDVESILRIIIFLNWNAKWHFHWANGRAVPLCRQPFASDWKGWIRYRMEQLTADRSDEWIPTPDTKNWSEYWSLLE